MDPQRFHHVRKMHKALYGLKQVPCAWFQHFSTFILHHGLVQVMAEPSLFTFHHGMTDLILLLYVYENVVSTRNNFVALRRFMDRLSHEFDIKDLGPLHYFLGREVRCASVSLHLSQTKHALDLLKRMNMIDCKPCSTPISCRA